MDRVLRVVCCAALVLLAAHAADAGGPSVEARWRLATPSAETGPTELALLVSVEKGWHLNANDPDRPYLIPTTLEIEAPAGTKVESIHYPDPVVRTLAFASGTALRLYEGAFTIAVRVAGALPEHFDARLGYQACNEETCLPPRTLPVPFDAKAVRGSK